MNQSKFESIERGLTVQARKVYDVVPQAESWDVSQIMSELHRRDIPMHDLNVVRGCIASLVDCGLVKEPKRGSFMKVCVRPPKAIKEFASLPHALAIAKSQQESEPVQQPQAKPEDPIERIGNLTKRVRALQAELISIANEIEDAGIALAEREQQAAADAKKFRELRSLFSS